MPPTPEAMCRGSTAAGMPGPQQCLLVVSQQHTSLHAYVLVLLGHALIHACSWHLLSCCMRAVHMVAADAHSRQGSVPASRGVRACVVCQASCRMCMGGLCGSSAVAVHVGLLAAALAAAGAEARSLVADRKQRKSWLVDWLVEVLSTPLCWEWWFVCVARPYCTHRGVRRGLRWGCFGILLCNRLSCG